MGKLVILKISEGSFEQGFPVTLQLGEENARPTSQVLGKLPPDPELPELYQQWQLAYKGLGLRSRLSAPDEQVKNVSLVQDCDLAAKRLSDRFNLWLQADSFRAIREKWLEKLLPDEAIRVIMQTKDLWLQRLPWHLWDLLERYPKAEIALSAPAYDQVTHTPTPAGRVSVLAILGNSKGIDIQADRELLEQLPDAEVRLLVEPSHQEISDRLWEHPWDILFFAGHSSTQSGDNTGRIYINQQDSLTISQLKYALKKAMERGLKLAIFNSCDGLGLARELVDLHIPQVIVMREPVPDQVAQAFLKYFLQIFSSGNSLYPSVRQARERLQALEGHFPCATWLPVIYQNPAELPPTWNALKGNAENLPLTPDTRYPTPIPSPDTRHPTPVSSPTTHHLPLKLRTAVGISLAIATLISGIRYLGLLQPVELFAFDHLTRLRPDEGTDSRVLIITIDDSDIQKQPGKSRGSLSDAALSQLMTKLDRYQPSVVGLDIYRDQPVAPQYPSLVKQLKQNGKWITTCKVSDADSKVAGVAPPPEVPSDRVGFSDFLEDSDGIVRRQLLFMDVPPDSLCNTPYSFSVQLASRYLAAKEIQPSFTPDGNLQFGQTVFHSVRPRTGGYQGIDAWGNQILLNYRATRRPFAQVSLSQVLTGQINASAIKDRVVLVGVVDRSFGDYWSTPYGTSPAEKMAGVVVQAEMTGQIISAVLDRRPLLWVWSQGAEVAWIVLWSLISGTATWWLLSRSKTLIQTLSRIGVVVVVASGALCLICFGIMTQGGWIPLIPPALAIGSVASAIGIYQGYRNQRSSSLTLHQE